MLSEAPPLSRVARSSARLQRVTGDLALALRRLRRVEPVRGVEAPADIGSQQTAGVDAAVAQDRPGNRVAADGADTREEERLARKIDVLPAELIAQTDLALILTLAE